MNAPAPRTHFTPKNSPPPRRRLAPNVVCLFDDDRPPIVNTRRRGRLPGSVARFCARPHAIGDVVEVFYGGTNPNNCRQVKIVCKHPSTGDFLVEAMSGVLHTFDNDGKPNEKALRAYCPPKKLRRIPKRSSPTA